MKEYILLFILVIFDSCVNIAPEQETLTLPFKEAEQLVKDFHSYGKIQSMDDGSRCIKSINGIQVRLTKERNESINCNGEFIDNVLLSMSIDKFSYDNFRNRLNKTKLRYYTRDSCFDLFTVDGFVNDEWGFIRIDCDTLPTTPFNVGSHQINFIENIKEKWYRYGGH